MVNSPKWKIEAASTAVAWPSRMPSTRWSRLPTPPEAITGTETPSATACVSGRSKPRLVAARSIGVSGSFPGAGAERDPLLGIFDGVDASGVAPAMGKDFPTVRSAAALHPFGVDRHHDALIAEFFRGFLDEFAAADGGRVDRNFIGAGSQQGFDIVDRADAATDRQRHEAGLCGAPDHIQHDAAIFMGRRNIEKAQLIGAGGVVGDRRFHGIAGIAQIDEVDALHHPAVLDVETGDHAHLEHGETPTSLSIGA